MKFIAPLVSEFKAIFGAPFKRSEEYTLLASALDSIARGDKPWHMDKIVDSLPKHMSSYEKRKLKKQAEAHAKVIEAQLYRQALCRFSLGEDLDLEKEAANARSLGLLEYGNQQRASAICGAQQAVGNLQAAYQNYDTQMQMYEAQKQLALKNAAQQNYNGPQYFGTIK